MMKIYLSYIVFNCAIPGFRCMIPSRTSCGLILSQSHYVDNILGKFENNNSGIARTQVDVNLHLSKNKGECFSSRILYSNR